MILINAMIRGLKMILTGYAARILTAEILILRRLAGIIPFLNQISVCDITVRDGRRHHERRWTRLRQAGPVDDVLGT